LVNGFSQIGSPDNATYYDLPQYRPFWSEVARLGVPFYLHPRNPLPSQQLAYEGHPWLLGPPWGFSVETGIHALRLMASGLFDEFPALAAILGHLGELVANNIWRTSHWASPGGKHPMGVPIQHSFIDCFRQHFYVTTSGFFRTIAMRNAMEEIGTERVLFSIDYPCESMEEGSTWFDAAEVGDNDREKIGRYNAAQLFNLSKNV
jgi:gamma-resorcylate decarboxylase